MKKILIAMMLITVMMLGITACDREKTSDKDNIEEVADTLEKADKPVIEVEKEPQVEVESEPVDEVGAEVVEEKDPVMEKIAKEYINAISTNGQGFSEYGLAYISSSGYPQLIMLEPEENLSIYTVENGELVKLNAVVSGSPIENWSLNLGRIYYYYYEKQDKLFENNGYIARGCDVYKLQNNEFDYVWGYGCSSEDELTWEPDEEGNAYPVSGYHTSWCNENGELMQSDHNKTEVECIEELKTYEGDGKAIGLTEGGTFEEYVEYKSSEEMITYLETFINSSTGKTNDEDWKGAYRKCINEIFAGEELLSHGGDGIRYGEGESNPKIYITLQDITDDGIPELLINPTQNEKDYYWSAYTVKNGTYERMDLGEASYIVYYDAEKKKIYSRNVYAASADVYSVNNGDIVSKTQVYDDGNSGESVINYYRDDGNGEVQITKDEWKAFWTEYEAGLSKYRLNNEIEITKDNIDQYL